MKMHACKPWAQTHDAHAHVRRLVKPPTSAAARHSADMATNNFFSHTGSDGSTVAERSADAGFDTFPLGENIAAGYRSVRAVVLAWMWCVSCHAPCV